MKKMSGIVLFVLLQPAWAENQPSVLFVNVDDWNDWTQVLEGHPQAVTPNIGRLAERGVVFSNAICASPTCLPSRTSLFSGIHPARSGNIVNDNGKHPWRFYVPGAVTLPKHLSGNGWRSIGIGKNFHGGDAPEFDEYVRREREPTAIKGSGIKLNPSGHWGIAAVPTAQMPDYIAVSRGIERLTSVDGPLFLSLGIYRPHVPWVVPQEYFDRYPLDEVQFPERRADDLDDLPERFRLLAHLEAKFGPGYNDMLAEKGYDRQFVRAYLACVTFADEQLGRILDAWDASPHARNGYIVLWSDHGYNLGEKGAWSKMKPWYDSAHSNLIIAGPGVQKGAVCNKAVSLQDLYPTLVDLLKIPPPPQQIDGNSLVPLLKDPDAAWDRPVVMSSESDGIRWDVVLDNDYRMTRLITGETELYKLADDPHEFNNLARDPEYAPVIARLAKHLTFRYPEFTPDAWIEAEDTPRQTSSDYKLRGTKHPEATRWLRLSRYVVPAPFWLMVW
jgi:arylsulfatase A-like enzyme